jgi:hypothetical protein
VTHSNRLKGVAGFAAVSAITLFAYHPLGTPTCDVWSLDQILFIFANGALIFGSIGLAGSFFIKSIERYARGLSALIGAFYVFCLALGIREGSSPTFLPRCQFDAIDLLLSGALLVANVVLIRAVYICSAESPLANGSANQPSARPRNLTFTQLKYIAALGWALLAFADFASGMQDSSVFSWTVFGGTTAIAIWLIGIKPSGEIPSSTV